jgi:hypothetical protein
VYKVRTFPPRLPSRISPNLTCFPCLSLSSTAHVSGQHSSSTPFPTCDPPRTSPSSQPFPSHMMSRPLPPRWDHHSDGSFSRLSSFPNFSTPLPSPPPFPSSLNSKSLPITSSLPVLSPLHNDSSFPLWSPVAPPPIPQMIGDAFDTFVGKGDDDAFVGEGDDDDGGDDDGASDDAGATPAIALPLFLSASPTFSPITISRGPFPEPGTTGPGLGITCSNHHDPHGAGDCGVSLPTAAPSNPLLTHSLRGRRVRGASPSSPPSSPNPILHSPLPVRGRPRFPSPSTARDRVRSCGRPPVQVPPRRPCMKNSPADPPKHPSWCGQRWGSGGTECQDP